jgi:kinesin family protein 6/9
LREEFSSDAFGDDENTRGVEEIIDEEELMLLKEMKDLKKGYRENFDKMQNLKVEVSDLRTNIDNMKQQMIYNFENWYIEEFE